MARLAIEARGLTRSFSGFLAVDHVDLEISEGSTHALIGPNGAGKSTCFNLLTRFLDATSGQIFFYGEDISRKPASEVARMGLVRSFQISAVFPKLTVLENVRLALQRREGSSLDFWRSNRRLRALDREAKDLLGEVGLSETWSLTAESLSYGQKRLLEIVTTVALAPRVILLDEPTAGMASEAIQSVIAFIRRVREGRTIVMVEHNLAVVQDLCDTITVLTRGKVLAEGDYASLSANPAVISAYLGSEHA